MRDSMLGHGLRPPAFDFRDGYLIVSLPGRAQAWSNLRVSPEMLTALDVPQRKLVELVLAGGRIGTKDSAAKLGISIATARRYLSGPVQQGILATHGKGSRLSYQLAGCE
jgi:predicted HTH transcriptional regulator